MSFRKFVGLAAIGGLLYAHKRRGGQFTIESFKDSWNQLVEGACMKAQDARMTAESKLHDAANRVADATDAETVSGYGSSGYNYGKSGSSDFRR